MAEDIVWRNERTPASARFGDVYFSAEDGVAESRHVFLDGIGAPDSWRNQALTTLGETGFGTRPQLPAYLEALAGNGAAFGPPSLLVRGRLPPLARDLGPRHGGLSRG